MDVGLNFYISLVKLCDFSLPQLRGIVSDYVEIISSRSSTTCGFGVFFSTYLCHLFSLLVKQKSRTLTSARISLSLHCVCVPLSGWTTSSGWKTSSAMGQLILSRSKHVFLLFQLPISNVMFFLSVLLWCDWLPSTLFNILYFP